MVFMNSLLKIRVGAIKITKKFKNENNNLLNWRDSFRDKMLNI